MKFDFIIIGSGLAGLSSALVLKDFGEVLIVTKGKIEDSTTNLAQGGIAAVVESDDSFESHIKDTLRAGCFHNNKKAVEYMIRYAPKAINWLIKQGVCFDRKDGEFSPTQEAAHTFPRVLHATDFTGREIERVLVEKVKKEKNILIWENCFVVNLMIRKGVCHGIQALADRVALKNFAKVGKNFSAHFPSSPRLFFERAGLMAVGVLKKLAFPQNSYSPFSLHPLTIDCFSRVIILATGGLGQLYQWTTNPEVATGDGYALSFRAGAKLKDMEFIQFHPTALRDGKSPLFLLSEALRGEGGYLIKIKNQKSKIKNQEGHKFRTSCHSGLSRIRSWSSQNRDSGVPRLNRGPQNDDCEIRKGERFMGDYDERLELAPRDVVARAIFNEQKKGFEVYLDIRHRGETFIKKRFPNIYKELKKRGFDLTKDLIPVTPAAHYSCGGVETDLYGRTNIKNLFAFGEVACTGVHGANRLASNSLLEAVVFPMRLKNRHSGLSRISDYKNNRLDSGVPRLNRGPQNDIKKIRANLQHLMWEKVGIVRSFKELKEAKEQIERWEEELEELENGDWSREFLELKNMLFVSRLITQAALKRKKSLGAHFILKR